jgi:hypothetical protein
MVNWRFFASSKIDDPGKSTQTFYEIIISSRIIIRVPMDLYFERPEEGIMKKGVSSAEKASLGKKSQTGDPEDQPAPLDPFYRSPGTYPHQEGRGPGQRRRMPCEIAHRLPTSVHDPERPRPECQ